MNPWIPALIIGWLVFSELVNIGFGWVEWMEENE